MLGAGIIIVVLLAAVFAARCVFIAIDAALRDDPSHDLTHRAGIGETPKALIINHRSGQ